jgi:hypothetical protein
MNNLKKFLVAIIAIVSVITVNAQETTQYVKNDTVYTASIFDGDIIYDKTPYHKTPVITDEEDLPACVAFETQYSAQFAFKGGDITNSIGLGVSFYTKNQRVAFNPSVNISATRYPLFDLNFNTFVSLTKPKADSKFGVAFGGGVILPRKYVIDALPHVNAGLFFHQNLGNHFYFRLSPMTVLGFYKGSHWSANLQFTIGIR